MSKAEPDDSIETPGPTMGELQAAGATMAAHRLSEQLHQTLILAVHLKSYHLAAQTLGVSRESADEILSEIQGESAGSSPSAADLHAATVRLHAHVLDQYTPMTDVLLEAADHLATTTPFSFADLAAAVRRLRDPQAQGKPWADDRIAAHLPAIAEMATRSRGSVAHVAVIVRQETT